LLNEKGEFVINMVEPEEGEEFDYRIAECARILYYEYGDIFLDVESYDASNSTCDLSLNFEETHNVKIVYNYDEEIKKVADELVATFPETGEEEEFYFRVKDLELINYWLTRTGDSDLDEMGGGLDNYSSELKALLVNKNFNFYVDNAMGDDSPFFTLRCGMALLKYNDIVYYFDPTLGTKAEHVFYVPDETGDSKEALLAAVQERIDAYVGTGKVEVAFGGQGILSFMTEGCDEAIAKYDVQIAEAEAVLAEYDAKIAELEVKMEKLDADLLANEENLIYYNSLKIEYEAEKQLLQERANNLQMEISAIAEEMSRLSEELDNLSVVYDDLNKEELALKEEYENKSKDQEYADRLASIEARRAETDEIFNQKKEAYNSKQLKCDELSIELGTVDEQIIELDEEFEPYAKLITAIEADIQEINSERFVCETELRNVQNEKLNYTSTTYDNLVMYRDLEIGYKQYTVDSYENEDGYLNFLKDAEGDYWFEVTIHDEIYTFIVIKDSDRMFTPTYASADITTDVTVSSTDSSIPLDTRVDVDKLTNGIEYDKIMNVLDVEENITFDISLYSDAKGDKVTKLENGTFEVKIPLTDELKDKDLVAYYVDENDEIVEYEVTVDEENGCAVFATDHFSIYTIAEVKEVEPAPNPTPDPDPTPTPDPIPDPEPENPGTGNEGSTDSKPVPAPEVVIPENNAAGSVIEEEAETVVEKVPFTEEEKAEIEAGAEVVITLDVKDITETVSAEDKTKVEAEAKEQTVGMYLDVNMFKQVGDNAAVKIPELNGKIKIQLTVPEELLNKDAAKNRVYSVIRIHEDEVTVLDTTFDDATKYLSFETDHFSTYALVYKDVVKVPNTGDDATIFVWMMLLAVGGCTIAYGMKRRHS
ncbi:MAG: hypothetical protein IKL07_05610, partial [Clostridium sp.]|nr:hypothetical protein [Clostridium sp.]